MVMAEVHTRSKVDRKTFALGWVFLHRSAWCFRRVNALLFEAVVRMSLDLHVCRRQIEAYSPEIHLWHGQSALL
jgi:hypothetical protein